MKKVKFDIQGMTCSSCSAHVEKTVCKLEGTRNVSVNLLSNSMMVEYDEKQLNNAVIIKSVIDAGYSANVSGIEAKTKNKIQFDKDSDDTIKSMKTRLIWSVIFLIPLMYVAMHHMLPTPEVIKNIFHGTENALIFA